MAPKNPQSNHPMLHCSTCVNLHAHVTAHVGSYDCKRNSNSDITPNAPNIKVARVDTATHSH